MKQLTTISLICISYFIAAIVLLHFLRPDLNPIARPTSEYAVGPYGFLMTGAFLGMSVGSLCLVFGLNKGMSLHAKSRLGLVLFGIWGVGVLIAMTFPIDPEGTELTTTGIIHRINGPLVFLCLTIGIILVSRSFGRDQNWRSLYPSARNLSLILLIFFIVTGVSVAAKLGFEGLFQRVFLIVFASWFILTTMHLRSLTTKNKMGL